MRRNRSEEVLSEPSDVKRRMVGETAWTPGSDIRTRAALLCRTMARLYRLRGMDNDYRRSIHWYKIANILDELDCEITTIEEVESMKSIQGVGASTIRVLSEIVVTGYLDYIDDLLTEVDDSGSESQLETLTEIHQRIEDLQMRNRERRQRMRHLTALHGKPTQKVVNVVNSGIRMTGAERIKALGRLPKADTQQTTPSSRGIRTRSQARKDIVEDALKGACEDDNCAICLEEYKSEEELIIFECRHCYHTGCIVPWLQARLNNAISPSCPLCRKPIKI